MLILFSALISCQKELEEVEETVGTVEKVLYEGKFVGSPRYNTSGDVKVVLINGKEKLQFINFKTDAGPDLKIYAATDIKAGNFVELSNQVKNGTYTVDLENTKNFDSKPFILIWCKQFSVLFGSAELMKK
jgi:hypothetical protein